MFVENWLGFTQSQIRTYIFLIMDHYLLMAAKNGATNIFPWFFPILLSFLWLLYNYFIVPNFQAGHAPLPPLVGAHV
jgi:hypothetical protein